MIYSRVALAAAVIAAASTAPILKAEQRNQDSSTRTPIKHVVVIDMENHSFDNIFGFWCDAHPSRCPDGGMPASLKLSNGAVVKPEVDPDTIPDVRHTVSAQLAAMNVSSGVPQMNGREKHPGRNLW